MPRLLCLMPVYLSVSAIRPSSPCTSAGRVLVSVGGASPHCSPLNPLEAGVRLSTGPTVAAVYPPPCGLGVTHDGGLLSL